MQRALDCSVNTLGQFFWLSGVRLANKGITVGQARMKYLNYIYIQRATEKYRNK